MISRDLLWEAWPEGYLVVPGVTTIGGWHCMRSGGTWVREIHGRHTIQAFDTLPDSTGYESLISRSEAKHVVKEGDLLPNVNPDDIATWACLLTDIGGVCLNHITRPFSPGWELWRFRDGNLYAKRLFLDDALKPTFYTDDPALALVTYRIQLRREAS